MKRLAVLLAVLALLPFTPSAVAAPTCDPIELQAWWAEDGMDIPAEVGHHVHLGLCWPTYGTVLDGTLQLPVTVHLHAAPADSRPVHLRAQWGLSGNQLYRRTTDLVIPLDANRNGTRSFTIPLDLSQVPTGSQEFRFQYEIRYTVAGETREQFPTSGLQACVRSCSGPDRAVPWYETRGWYTDRSYQNARLRSDTTCLRPGGTCKVEMKPGSGGRPTVQSWAVIDPDFHAGSAGRVLAGFPRAGAFSGNVTIPADLSAGNHKLVLVTSDGQNAGVAAFTFTVGSGPAPTPTPVPTPVATPTPFVTPSPTPTPVATPTPTPTIVPTPPVCVVLP